MVCIGRTDVDYSCICMMRSVAETMELGGQLGCLCKVTSEVPLIG